MYRCIYCGKQIPSSIGLRCPDCDKIQQAKQGFQYQGTKNPLKDYDREFAYDTDTIEPGVAKLMEETEVPVRSPQDIAGLFDIVYKPK